MVNTLLEQSNYSWNSQLHYWILTFPLYEMCPNTEFFLVRIFPHSDWIRRDSSYLSVFSPNVRKYGPEKTPYLDAFHAVLSLKRNILWKSGDRWSNIMTNTKILQNSDVWGKSDSRFIVSKSSSPIIGSLVSST